MQQQAVMLLGPTASGKSALSLLAAERVDCEIISVDSALVYRGMDIGTAKPTQAEMRAVPHHLIDIRSPLESYSAADFEADCHRLIKAIRARGKVPLIVGGTMLYAKALREGLSELPPTDAAVRRKVQAELAESGLAALYEQLQSIDPVTAARLKRGDTQRICRAIEVFRITGKPISNWQTGLGELDESITTLALMPSDRAELHQRIQVRFDQMLEDGFLDEVRALMAIKGMHEDLSSMRSVGYRQAWAHLAGETDFKTFREAGMAATRQLAKRQITWLRAMKGVQFFDRPDKAALDGLVQALRDAQPK